MEYNEALKTLVNVAILLGESIQEREAIRQQSDAFDDQRAESLDRAYDTIDDLREKLQDQVNECARLVKDNEQLRQQVRAEHPSLIQRIRALRALTGMGLTDSKKFLEILDAQVRHGVDSGKVDVDDVQAVSTILRRLFPTATGACG